MKKRFLAQSFVLVMLFACFAVRSQNSVGHWNDHFSYRQVRTVAVTPTEVYAAAPLGLIACDRTNNALRRLSKSTGLNDVGVSTMAYDSVTATLVVAYDNANVDLLCDGRLFNLSDLRRSSIAADKSIHSIAFHKRCAYLACGFGIVVVDLDRHEIKETYFIGDQGSYLNVFDLAFTDSLVVAATELGLRWANKDSQFLNLITNWRSDSASLFAGQPVRQIAVADGKILAVVPDGAGISSSNAVVYRQVDARNFVPWIEGDIRAVRVAQGRIIVANYSDVQLYDFDFSLRHGVSQFDGYAMQALDATLSSDGTLWVGHDWYGLVELPQPYGDNASIWLPSGPVTDNAYKVVSYGSRTFLCPGGHSSTYEGRYLAPYLCWLQNGRWSQLDRGSGLQSALRDLVDVAVNPKDTSQLLAASWGVGVAHIQGNQVDVIYTDTNSDGALKRYWNGGYNALFTGSVAYDLKGNAWMTNSLQNDAIVRRNADGSWLSLRIFNDDSITDIDHVIWDSIRDYAWFYGRPNRIFVAAADGRRAYVDPNNGSKLSTSRVNCLAQDHRGDIWIGTDKGIKYIYDGRKAFDNGGAGEKSPVTCANKLIEEDGFTEYLMAYESVTCIAVDGGDRKWVGTSAGGLYLLSSDGGEQLLHFTSANSPLASDKIVSISIEPWSGEVFVATDRGLQSYRGTATYADYLPQDDIHAFPNPVRPGYAGPIAIKGFTRNALVHITDVAGHTVYSTRATGGQAVWMGTNNEGKPVASGVYFVFASDEAGRGRCVTKVLIVR